MECENKKISKNNNEIQNADNNFNIIRFWKYKLKLLKVNVMVHALNQTFGR